MPIKSYEIITLLFVISFGIYICYRSRLKLLEAEAFSINSRKHLREAIVVMNAGVDQIKILNNKLENFNKTIGKSHSVCGLDSSKECTFCNGDCPFIHEREGGE